MKTNRQTQPDPSPCCGANPKSAAADCCGGGPTPAWPDRAVDWTDGMRPFLGFYVFKG